jgi:hypothetical protein
MTGKRWALLCGLAGVLLGTSVSTGKPQTGDPPGTTVYMATFRAWFAAADTNKDGILDKEELAHAFRGPYAKPYDYVPPRKEKPSKAEDMKKAEDTDNPEGAAWTDDKDGVNPDKDKDKEKTDDREKSSKNSTEKDKASKAKPEKKPDYSRYADYKFLVQLDSDNDEQISREEYLHWARDLAVQLKQQADAQQKALELQARLQRDANRIKPADRRRVENDLRRERERMERFQAEVNRLQRNFEQAQIKAEEARKRR